MTNFLFTGDTHGDIAFAEKVIRHARRYGAEVVQLGDWGYLWPGHDQLQALSKLLVANGVTCRFLDGNHDDHPRLRRYVSACAATPIAPNVIYQPRGSVHEDGDGTRFLFLGGAPSIDRAHRTAGRSWWPEEVITIADRDRALSAPGPIHVLVTHDAPAFPPGFSPKGTPAYCLQQEESMRHVDAIARHHRPELLIHGHWHTRATTQRGATRVEAIDCNTAPFNSAVLLWSRASEARS